MSRRDRRKGRLGGARLRVIALLTLLAIVPSPVAADTISFWSAPQHGGNSFNRVPPSQAYFDALAGYGATWVRLAFDKWKGQKRDFLIGDADHYDGLVPEDLTMLRATIERAHKAGLGVVIAPLSLPGMRWAQNNGGQFDDRLWTDKSFWDQSARFWRDLAGALRDEPGVVAYNIVNEPAPEKKGGLADHADAAAMIAWYATVKGTARDLPAFYRKMVSAIRAVDPTTPIMLDSGFYGAADGFTYWPGRIEDPAILYSAHMYEPYEVTSAPNMKRDPPLLYPGTISLYGQEEHWDRARVADYLAAPGRWAAAHGVPDSHLVIGEFGCMRQLSFCPRYLEDVLSTLDSGRRHWAFYSFREDAWDGMDYELGSGPPEPDYWQKVSDGRSDAVKRERTAVFEPIARRLESWRR